MTTANRTLQSIADTIAAHEAAYHPGQLCPEDQHGHCAARPRPVESPEDRMRHATADATARAEIDQAITAAIDAHTAAYHPGLPCVEDQDGRCTALPGSPRATAPDRSFATYLDRHERDQLDARAAAAEQERDDALDDRDQARRERDEAIEARDVLRQQLDATKAAKKRVLGRLEMAEHVIDLMRDASEQLDRALAAWETQQQPALCSPPCTLPKGHPWECDANGYVPPSTGLGSPAARAQEGCGVCWTCRATDPADHFATVVRAALDWRTAVDIPQPGTPRAELVAAVDKLLALPACADPTSLTDLPQARP